MRTAKDIQNILQAVKAHLIGKYPIESMAIFGSIARNEATAESDVDILVKFNGKVGWKFLTLAEELEQLLGMKVDLVSEDGLKPRYLNYIKKDLIYV
ncbi:MAG: nucleotidyltransferase family protein [Saprospiraceae bacterium]|nr:nucleotidyltransferase family protein [Saprospiraceae bacterium]